MPSWAEAMPRRGHRAGRPALSSNLVRHDDLRSHAPSAAFEADVVSERPHAVGPPTEFDNHGLGVRDQLPPPFVGDQGVALEPERHVPVAVCRGRNLQVNVGRLARVGVRPGADGGEPEPALRVRDGRAAKAGAPASVSRAGCTARFGPRGKRPQPLWPAAVPGSREPDRQRSTAHPARPSRTGSPPAGRAVNRPARASGIVPHSERSGCTRPAARGRRQARNAPSCHLLPPNRWLGRSGRRRGSAHHPANSCRRASAFRAVPSRRPGTGCRPMNAPAKPEAVPCERSAEGQRGLVISPPTPPRRPRASPSGHRAARAVWPPYSTGRRTSTPAATPCLPPRGPAD